MIKPQPAATQCRCFPFPQSRRKRSVLPGERVEKGESERSPPKFAKKMSEMIPSVCVILPRKTRFELVCAGAGADIGPRTRA